ncbi:tetratricopeptide repeat protein [Bacillus sp. AK128]
MKLGAKLVLTMLVSTLTFCLLTGIIFILDGMQGIILGVVGGIVYISLFFYSFILLVSGKCSFLFWKGRAGSLLVMMLTVFFFLYTTVLVLINTYIEIEHKAANLGLVGKTRIAVNLFIPLGYMDDLKKEQFREITFQYQAGDEETVQFIKALYPKTREKVETYLGDFSYEPLTIFIYPDIHTLAKYTSLEEIGGYYQRSNRSIHVVSKKQYSADYQYEELIKHEYTHYAYDMFLKQNNISSFNIPLWFTEGIANLVAKDGQVDISFTKTSFRELDTSTNFHQARKDYDPYLQSYFAVRELVLEHGPQVLQNLLLQSKHQDFYEGFTAVTGLTIVEFEETFMNRKEKVQSLQEASFAASQTKDYAEAERLILEAYSLDSEILDQYDFLPHLYIKQRKFDDAIQLLEKIKDHDYSGVRNYRLLSELYLLKDIDKALEYAGIYEQGVNGGGEYGMKWLQALSQLEGYQNPEGYITLLESDLMTYHEIKIDLLALLIRNHPNDSQLKQLQAYMKES